MIEIKSKLIDGVVYLAETQRLILHMANGHRREYLDVPPGVYEGLLGAKSAGEYYQTVIKRNYEPAE